MKEMEALDMHNQMSSEELEQFLRLQLQTLQAHPDNARLLPPLMVWGAPGIGKSSIIRGLAAEFGIGFIDIRLAQREPVDIRGLPVPDEDSIRWLVSSDWPRDPDSRGIILFDELTAADRSLQVAAYELILDRRLGDLYQVPPGWYICAAGNRVDDAAVAMTMSSALANRFMHTELKEDVDAWVKWGQQNGIHPSVRAFIRYRPECLLRQDDENVERGWPSPRSWERVSFMLDSIGRDNESLLRKMVYGLVGNRAGIEFVSFHLLNENFEDVRRMMLDPSIPVHIPEKVDRRFALCAAMSHYVWRGKTREEETQLLDGFYRISLKLPSDFASMVMMDAMVGNRKTVEDTFAAKLFHHTAYKTWAKEHGTALRRRLKVNLEEP